MTLSAAFAIALLAGSATRPELCSGVENRIEPDMRILESDLTRSAALAATDKLKGMIERGDSSEELRFGAINQSKIIYGYLLLRQARADREAFGAGSAESRDSTGTLCTWL